jgi:hypothetical protein
MPAFVASPKHSIVPLFLTAVVLPFVVARRSPASRFSRQASLIRIMVSSCKRFSTICLLLFSVCWLATLCLSQTGQVRHLAYSTYSYPEALPPVFNLSGGNAGVAANAVGQVCASSQAYELKINPDGSQAYLLSNSSLSIMRRGPSPSLVAIDTAGNCYLDGIGTIVPTPGAFQPSSGSGNFVVKLDPNGKVVFATYLGGSGTDGAEGIAVDGTGNVWVTGFTESNDFPTKNPIQSSFQGGTDDVFVAALSPDGTQLLFGTYLGGGGNEQGAAITIDTNGAAYITGATSSTNFPTLNPLEATLQAAQAAFVSKIDASGHLVYSTYLGQTSGAAGIGIAVDPSQNMYVTGTAPDDGFPLVNPLQTTSDASFICKLNPAGSALLYSTYFGTGAGLGADPPLPAGIQVDTQGNAYVAGNLLPGTVPLLNAIETTPYAGYVAALDTNGALLFSSYFGTSPFTFLGFPENMVSAMAIDGAGGIVIGAGDGPGGPIPLLNAIYGTMTPFISGPDLNVVPFVSKIAVGPGASFSMPTGVNFGAFPVGSNTTSLVGVFNTGTTDITISNIAITGEYSQTNDCPATLLAATDCQFQVTFAPTDNNPSNGAITITDNSPGSPHVIQLMGNEGTPSVSLNPTGLNFGSQQVGTNSTVQEVTLNNTGTGALQIYQVSITGDFQETNNCGFSVGAQSHCTISVTFRPTVDGVRTGTLSIADNASNSPQMVSLAGTGTGTGAPPGLGLGIPPGGSSSATVPAGKPANYTLAIGGQGVSGMATLTCTGAPAAATCSAPASENVSGTSASTFPVSVTTTVRNAAMVVPPGLRLGWEWAMGIVVMALLPSASPRKRLLVRKLRVLPFALLIVLCACGGGSGGSSNPAVSNPTGTPAGTYTLTVTATMGSSVQSTKLTLTVK